MLYEFLSLKDDSIKLIDYPMADAPKFGEIVEHEGERYERIPSVPHLGRENTHTKYHFVSRSLPKDPGNARGLYKRTDKEGRPLFDSKQEIVEVCARSEGGLIYDAGTEHLDG